MKIKPFKGIRPPKELVEQVSSRPYDVLNSEEARLEAAGNEMSLYHIIKPEINFAPGTDEHDPRVYPEAKSQYQRFKIKGWFRIRSHIIMCMPRPFRRVIVWRLTVSTRSTVWWSARG